MLTAILLAALDSFVENPRFCSPNGEICLVVRRYPRIGDFDRVASEEYWQPDPIQAWLDEYPREEETPPKPHPTRAALYRRWPSEYQELLSELSFYPDEASERIVVTDEAFVVSHRVLRCEKDAELLTIRGQDGSILRTMKVADVFTKNDQDWLCRGSETDVRWFVEGSTLRATVLMTNTEWDDSQSRFASIEIELPDGSVSTPKRDLFPKALAVEVEPDDGLWRPDERITDAADVEPLDSFALLARTTHREIPEYPLVATRARIAGDVHVRVVVDREGRVESAIVKPLPFGIDQAVKDAIMKWTFQPDSTRYSGWLVFRFRIVRHVRISTQPVASRAVTSFAGTSSS